MPEEWVAGFAKGLGADADAYRCPLLGGDTDSTPGPISISIAALGTVPAGKLARRSKAQVDHHVFVTGTIGDAALGLRARRDPDATKSWGLDAAMREHLVSRHRLPLPRVALTEIVLHFASASMDISDGLAGDLAKMCRASNVSADIDVARVPLSEAAARALSTDKSLIEPILTGGEDYEMLFTIYAALAGDVSGRSRQGRRPGHGNRPNRGGQCAAAISRSGGAADELCAPRLQPFLSKSGLRPAQ